MSTRITRSQSRNTPSVPPEVAPELPTGPRVKLELTSFTSLEGGSHVQFVEATQLAREIRKLPKKDAELLFLKQRKLKEPTAQIPTYIRERPALDGSAKDLHAEAAAAALTFAWEHAGTAVCISHNGLLLTCSHCIASSKKEFKAAKEQWLLFASGMPVRTKCIAWDQKRDLALLQITMAPADPSLTVQNGQVSFPFVQVADSAPKLKARLFCIGHPGSEDFEADEPGVATGYDVLHISDGAFRGYAPDQDVQDNSEIGALMHDCWTYWGHSGAPLVEKKSGKLIGLHSSWDDQTGMRRGIAYEAIGAFLGENTVEYTLQL